MLRFGHFEYFFAVSRVLRHKTEKCRRRKLFFDTIKSNFNFFDMKKKLVCLKKCVCHCGSEIISQFCTPRPPQRKIVSNALNCSYLGYGGDFCDFDTKFKLHAPAGGKVLYGPLELLYGPLQPLYRPLELDQAVKT